MKNLKDRLAESYPVSEDPSSHQEQSEQDRIDLWP
jgi:hypothetical protein